MKKLTLFILITVITVTCFAQKNQPASPLPFTKDSIKIKKEVDKYTGKKRYSTGMIRGYELIKDIEAGIPPLYILVLNGEGYNVSGKGVYIMFDNGKIYSLPDHPITTSVDNSDKFNYRVAISAMGDTLFNLLKTNYIISYRLSENDHELDCGQTPEEFKQQNYSDADIKKIMDYRASWDITGKKVNKLFYDTDKQNETKERIAQWKLRNFPLYVEALVQAD